MRADGSAAGAVGRSVPPLATRFRKGQSGNPRGRPKGSRRQPPYETILGQMVTVREEGVTRQMTAAEAFILHVTRKGLEGDSAAARAALAAIGEARRRRGPAEAELVRDIVFVPVAPGSVNEPMRRLRIAVKLDAYRPTARIALKPWVVVRIDAPQYSITDFAGQNVFQMFAADGSQPGFWLRRTTLDNSDARVCQAN